MIGRKPVFLGWAGRGGEGGVECLPKAEKKKRQRMSTSHVEEFHGRRYDF